jgi:hypothetical protein
MHRIRRHRNLLHTALLVLVAFGMLLQPVLAALGDLHEVEHAVALHSDHGHSHHDGHEVPEDEGEVPGDPVGSHGLLHACGAAAPVALLEPVSLTAAAVATGDPPDRGYVHGPPVSRLTLPFRPPIA